MPIYYIVNSQGEPINKIEWDGISQFTPPNGCTVSAPTPELIAACKACEEQQRLQEEQRRASDEEATNVVIQKIMTGLNIDEETARKIYNQEGRS